MLDHGGKVSGEVASIFENTEMYGQVVNGLRPSAGIHTFFLKWDMTRVPGGMHMQEYNHTVNTPPRNSNKFLLQTATNKEITMGYTPGCLY